MKKQGIILLIPLFRVAAVAVWGTASEPGSSVAPNSTLDSDADGLEDALERQAGTDPQLKDTDKDRLSDYDEYCKYESRPIRLQERELLAELSHAISRPLAPVRWSFAGGP